MGGFERKGLREYGFERRARREQLRVYKFERDGDVRQGREERKQVNIKPESRRDLRCGSSGALP